MAYDDEDTDDQEQSFQTAEAVVEEQPKSTQVASVETPSPTSEDEDESGWKRYTPPQAAAPSESREGQEPKSDEDEAGWKRYKPEPEAEGEVASFLRRAAHETIPTLAGVGSSILAAPALAGGPWVGVPAMIGAGMAGYAATKKAQEALLPKVGIDDEAQLRANELANPKSSFAGEFVPQLLAGRPGLGLNLANRALYGGLGGGFEAGRQYLQDDKFDPARIATAAGTGALLDRPTGLMTWAEQQAARLGGPYARIYGKTESPPPAAPPPPGPDQGSFPFPEYGTPGAGGTRTGYQAGLPLEMPSRQYAPYPQPELPYRAPVGEQGQLNLPTPGAPAGGRINEPGARGYPEAPPIPPDLGMKKGFAEVQTEMPLVPPSRPDVAPTPQHQAEMPIGTGEQGQFDFPHTERPEYGGKVPHGTPGSKASPGTAESQPPPTPPPLGSPGHGPENYGKETPPAGASNGVNVGPGDVTVAAAVKAKQEPPPAPPEPPTQYGAKLDQEFPKLPPETATKPLDWKPPGAEPPQAPKPAEVPPAPRPVEQPVPTAEPPAAPQPVEPPPAATAPARNPKDYLQLNPNVSAAEYAQRMSELRDNKPRPINKLWNDPTKAPPQKVAAAKKALALWQSEYNRVSRMQKLALARDNAAFQRGEKSPPQALDRTLEAERAVTERGRSGRPIRTEKLPIGTEEAILEKGYEKATGKVPAGEPQLEMQPKKRLLGVADVEKLIKDERGGVPVPEFVEKIGANLKAAGSKLARSYKETFQPDAISEMALKSDPQVARYNAARAGERDRIYNKMQETVKKWDKIPETEQIKFLSDVENGRPVAPEHAKDAKDWRQMLDEAALAEKQWGSKAGYIEDYFPHIWERKQGQQPIQERFTQSIGPTDFQHTRTIDLIERGIAAGYKLKSSNPAVIVRERLLAGADMRMRMELLNNMQSMGMATKVTATPNAEALRNQGWQEINAPDRERWMLAPDVQTLWKNGVEARGLWSNENLAGDAFRGWMTFKSLWVPIRLSLSAFHPLHVTHINFSTNMARAVDQMMVGDMAGAIKSFGEGFNLKQTYGKDMREQWLLGEGARTQEGKESVKLMEEGGFVPMLSEQLRIDAKDKFDKALKDMNPFGTAFHGMRYLNQQVQKPVFELWIPRLKTASYLNDVAAVLKRNPQLQNDPAARQVALRAVAKSIDNRFGEMFYGNLFWNRTVKDLGIGSFLSLGWNLGFVREFGGAALESALRPATKAGLLTPNATRQLINDSTNKIKFATIYMGTAAILAGMMTKMLSGNNPEGMDYIFPRVGGKNPDGSDRRLTTMFYSREIPMWQKHAQGQGGGGSGAFSGTLEMIYSKMLFEPFIELMRNRDYFGREIWDTNAPAYKQLMQAAEHIIGNQVSPMSVTGWNRVEETGGRPIEKPLSILGFGPAPSYAEKSALQNRITHLFQERTGGTKAYEDPEVTHDKQVARNKLLMAKQRGDPAEIRTATAEALKAGFKPPYLKTLGNVGSDQKMFQRLPQSDQVSLLRQANPEERTRYWKYTSKATKQQIQKENPTFMPRSTGSSFRGFESGT